MNKAFQQDKVIKLDDKWTLNPDDNNGVVLLFSEVRQRKNKKTGEPEDFLYEEPRYYTRIAQSLKAYLDISQNSSKSIEEIITKTEYILGVIENLDKTFKQFE